MGTCWGDIEEGVRIEVTNSDTNLSTKVYWIAEIIKLAGKTRLIKGRMISTLGILLYFHGRLYEQAN